MENILSTRCVAPSAAGLLSRVLPMKPRVLILADEEVAHAQEYLSMVSSDGIHALLFMVQSHVLMVMM